MPEPSFKYISKEAFLAKFPLDQLWRFFVDGLTQKYGWKEFENNEPGYLVGTYTAFLQECCTSYFEEPLSSSVLVRIHHCAVTGVRYTNYDKYLDRKDLYGKFREGKVHFGLCVGNNVSPEGYREILNLSKEYPNSITISNEKLYGQANNLARDVDRILKRYHQELAECDATEDKVKAIIKMVTEMERIHPFSDGNCRSICMITVMRECLKLNLYPPIVDNPNQYDGYSQQELYQKVMKGMERTYEITHFGFTSIPFEKTMLSPKGRSSKMYDANDFMPSLQDVFKYKVVFLSDTQYPKYTRSKRLITNDEKDHDFLLRAVFFEAWSVVGKRKMFRDESLQQAFNASFARYHQKYLEEIRFFSNIIAEIKNQISHSTATLDVTYCNDLNKDDALSRSYYNLFELPLRLTEGDKIWGADGVLKALIDLNCINTIIQLFNSNMIHPAFYCDLKFQVFVARRPQIESYIDEKMISTFVTLYTSREDKELNKSLIKIYWDYLKEKPISDFENLTEKVFLALRDRGCEIRRFPELSKSFVTHYNRKRKLDIETHTDSDFSGEQPSAKKKGFTY